MTETITIPEAWVDKGTYLKVTVYIEDGVLKRIVTNRRYPFETERPLPKNSKFTYREADEIRAEFARGGVTKTALGRKYGCTNVTIGNIISGRTYGRRA